MSGNTISIQVSEETASVISIACECLARQMMGQFDNALDPVWYGTTGMTAAVITDLREHLRAAQARFQHQDVSPAGEATKNVAWDVYQVVRQWLAYRRATDGGHTVDFHEPMIRSGERIGIESVSGEPDPRPMQMRLAVELEDMLGNDLHEAVRRVKAWKAAAESESLQAELDADVSVSWFHREDAFTSPVASAQNRVHLRRSDKVPGVGRYRALCGNIALLDEADGGAVSDPPEHAKCKRCLRSWNASRSRFVYAINGDVE